MDPITSNPLGVSSNSEAPISQPKWFTELPQVGAVSLKVSTPLVSLGIVSESHDLMKNPQVAAWAQDVCGQTILEALTAWLELDAQEVERIQSAGYKEITKQAKQLFEALITPEKGLPPG